MKIFLFKILSLITLFIPTKLLIKLSGKKIIYPFYNIISNNPPAHIKHLYPVRNIKQFEKDLDFLQNHFTASSFPTDRNNPQFVLSFDDGLKEVYETIAPVLKKRKIPAIFFINSAFVDNKDLFYKYKASIIVDEIRKNKLSEKKKVKISVVFLSKRVLNDNQITRFILNISYSQKHKSDKIADILEINFTNYLQENKVYLSKKQITNLSEDGYQIGSHGINHPLYSEINEVEQIKQTEESLNFIAENFHEKQKLFAFPFSDDGIKDTFFETVFNHKFADFTFGTAGIKDDKIKNNIQRIPVEKYGLSAKRHIKTELFLYIIKRFLGKNFVKR